MEAIFPRLSTRSLLIENYGICSRTSSGYPFQVWVTFYLLLSVASLAVGGVPLTLLICLVLRLPAVDVVAVTACIAGTTICTNSISTTSSIDTIVTTSAPGTTGTTNITSLLVLFATLRPQ